MDWNELSALYRAAPLGDKKPESLRTAFSNSRHTFFVYEDGRLVGTGLGKAIVGYLVERSRGHKKIILYSVPGKEAFYRKFGFLRMKTAMAIFENPQQQFERGYLHEE